MKHTLLACAALLLATLPAHAQQSSPLTTDRPGFTNGASIVGVGTVQVETGAAGTTLSEGGGYVTDLPEALIRTGLAPRLELRLTPPNYSAGGGLSGLGDSEIGVKYKFYDNGKAQAALAPSLSVPTGAAAQSSRHVDPSLLAIVQTSSGARWGLAANVNVSAPYQDAGRVAHYAPSASLSYTLTARLSSYGDVYDDVPAQGPSAPIADGGFTFLLNNNLQLDAEAGFGLSRAAPVRFIGGGLSVRF